MNEKKIVCYSCSASINISNKKELEKICCEGCGHSFTVPKIIGQFVLTEIKSESENYSVYKGYKGKASELLSIKFLKVKDNYTSSDFFEMKTKVDSFKAHGIEAVDLYEVENNFLIVRPWYTLSLSEYLKSKKPRAEQAVLFIKDLAARFKEFEDENKYLSNISLENLFLNDSGKIIITDLGINNNQNCSSKFDFKNSFFCFQNLCAEMCCQKPYRQGMALDLKLRGSTPVLLEEFLTEIFKGEALADFSKVLEMSNALNTDSVIEPDKETPVVKSEKNNGLKVSKIPIIDSNVKTEAVLKEPVKKPKKKSTSVVLNKPSKRRVKRNRNTHSVSSAAPLVFLVVAGIIALFFIADFGDVKEEPQAIATVEKKETAETRKPKSVKQKPLEPIEDKVIREIDYQQIVVKKPDVKADIKGGIEHGNFHDIISNKCFNCHGKEGNKVKGKFDFVKFLASSGVNQKAWKVIYNQIDKGEMPPEDEEQLTENEKMVVLNEISRIALSSQITRQTRPLTPNEIKNTLVDLFDINKETYDPFTPLYANYSIEKFYTMQKDIITPYYLDDLYEILHDSIESYIALNPQVDPLTLRATFPRRVHYQTQFNSKSDLRWGGKESNVVQVYFENLSKEPEVIKSRRQEVGPDSKVQNTLDKLSLPPGTYKLSFNAQAMNMDPNKLNEKKYGKDIVDRYKRILTKHEYSLPIEFFIFPPNQADPHARRQFITEIEINSSESSRYTVEFTLNRRNGIGYRFPIGVIPGDLSVASAIAKHIFGNSERKNVEEVYGKYLSSNRYDFPMVRFTDVRIEGPFNVNVSEYSVSKNEKMDNLTIREKFRKLHEDNFIQNNIPYDYVFNKFKQRKIEEEESYRNSLISFFLSPDFLTLEYDTDDKRKQLRLLSYTFHKTFPKSDMQQQIQKVDGNNTVEFTKWLVSHEKFKNFIDNFSYQWLHMGEIKNAMPDEKKFREFYNKNLLSNYRQEVIHFLRYLFIENRPVNELVTADYSFVNKDLAEFYDQSTGDKEFKKHKFNNKIRGGLLSSGAFLTATGNGVDPLPIKRAKWILENVLDSTLPPPPEEIELDRFQQDLAKPLHERLKAHSNNAACFSCHKKIDPLAVIMNRFDTIGDIDNSKSQSVINLDGESIKNFAELKSFLGSKDELIARSFVSSILRYGLGRELYIHDGEIINRIIKEHTGTKYPVRDLLNSIIQNYFF